jgi:succinylarginine dihydrolase
MQTREWQFDGLVGPTHNYAGLATGNMAAASNAGQVSNPRLAALQGLEKMRFVRDLGIPQAVLPPHFRPRLDILKNIGFTGNYKNILEQVARQEPGLLATVYSSAFMWTANAATVSPSRDTADGKVHFTPANLASHLHRAIEASVSYRHLHKIFHNQEFFTIHNSLYSSDILADEGAANHKKLNYKNAEIGHDIFVYGRSNKKTLSQNRFSPRQSRLASESIARLHGLNPDRCLFLQQSPKAVDAGVFHHDVIGMSTQSRMIVHADAFVDADRERMQKFFDSHPEYQIFEIDSQQLTLTDAVSSYFFNSQYVFLDPQNYAIVCPSECEESNPVRNLVDVLLQRGAAQQVHYLNVRESMRNGGGPACLRLRVELTEGESNSMHQGVVLTDGLYNRLCEWVGTHYRDRLCFDDLRDPELIFELERAYSELERILQLPGLYQSDMAASL